MRQADLYIRVSTDEQADKGYSQRDQEDRLRKYCEIKGITIRNVYIEDYSAKTFNRPEWQKYLVALRKIKKNTTASLLLFTKWDRFSRNAGDAYQMINLLRSFSVEPEAIEQPLDFDIPENKIMLAFYLATPEVENDRRSLNTFYGMRRAKKEGRYMGTAPLGYSNKITEDNKKYIGIHEVEGPLLKWAFEQIILNNYNTEQIWKMLRFRTDGKYRFSKNNFWVALRNPLYCGKIFIPAHKDEKAHFVLGQHEPLISESMFNEVQQILDGRKRKIKPKVVSIDNLPLRGFLKCNKCGKMLTGSASKGKMGVYYNYYHCSSSCGVRFKAEIANDVFLKQLKSLIPKKGMIDVFIEAFTEDFNAQTKTQNAERTNILNQIAELNNRKRKALIQKIDGGIEADEYIFLKKYTTEKIEQLEVRLNNLSSVNTEIKDLFKSGLKKIANLDIRYQKGNTEEKRHIISSIFPDFLIFDGTRHRTLRMNSAVELIYQDTNKLNGKKNGTNLSFLDLSQQVTRLGFEPRTHTLKVYCSTS